MLTRLRKSQESDRGFTLIELIVVVIIIGILAAIAVPAYTRFIGGSKSDALKAGAGNFEKLLLNSAYADVAKLRAGDPRFHKYLVQAAADTTTKDMIILTCAAAIDATTGGCAAASTQVVYNGYDAAARGTGNPGGQTAALALDTGGDITVDWTALQVQQAGKALCVAYDQTTVGGRAEKNTANVKGVMSEPVDTDIVPGAPVWQTCGAMTIPANGT